MARNIEHFDDFCSTFYLDIFFNNVDTVEDPNKNLSKIKKISIVRKNSAQDFLLQLKYDANSYLKILDTKYQY